MGLLRRMTRQRERSRPSIRPGIAEAHNIVVRRVDDQQRPAQRGDTLPLCLPADLAQIGHLSGIGGRGEGHHGACLGHPRGDRQDRRPAE
jgi:hypothetical protein